LAAQEEDDVERIKEESRRRRQAILDKYKKLQQTKVDAEEPASLTEG
jgi:serine/threonine-protein kinase PRP4